MKAATHHIGPLVIYSNQLEVLVGHLADRLYSDGDAFARRLIIVPTNAMKSWIQQQLVARKGIAAGIEFCFLQEGVANLAGISLRNVMTQSELGLRIEQETDLLLPQLPAQEGAEKQLGALADLLSEHFSQYGIYGGEMVKQWEESPQEWQEELWHRLYQGEESYWGRLLDQADGVEFSGRIFLMGFSFIPPLFWRFFQRIACLTEVIHYALSPCLAFWSDIQSDKQMHHLLAAWKNRGAAEHQLEELAFYLRDRNRLLANWGRLGRDMATLLEETPAEECYLQGDTETLLHAVQNDLLVFEEPKQRRHFSHEERSIAIHAATSRWREVEVAYQIITALSHTDVLVMAPDIGLYAPYIHAVFADLPISIADLTELEPGSIEEGFSLLLRLAISRFEPSLLVQFMEHPAQRTPFLPEEMVRIRQWLRQARIHWGQDSHDRQEWFNEQYGEAISPRSSPFTWSDGLSRLINALVCGEGLSLSDADLLERVVALLDDLATDLSFLRDRKEKTLATWVEWIGALANEYFTLETPLQAIRSLQCAAERLPSHQYAFSSVNRFLQQQLVQQRPTKGGQLLEAIRFSSMVPMRALPAQVILLVGMDEDSFPRISTAQPLNRLAEHPKTDRCPSRADFDRYLFLEALLSARSALHILYTSVSGEDGEAQSPSPVVTEFIDYLDQTATIDTHSFSQERIYTHPHLPFHPSYFNGTHPYPPGEEAFQLAAVEHAASEDSTEPTPTVFPEGVVTINLADLRATAANPIRSYLNKTMGIYLDEGNELLVDDDEAYTADPLDIHRLLWSSLDQPIEKVVDRAVQHGLLPPEPFQQTAKARLIEKWQTLCNGLQQQGVEPANLFTVHFSEGYQERTTVRDGVIGLPPVRISVTPTLQVRVIGELHYLSEAGMLVQGTMGAATAVKAWPQWACLRAAAEQLSVTPDLLSAQSGKRMTFPTISTDPLAPFIRYHLHSLQVMTPLLPDWIIPCATGDATSLTKAIDRELKGRYKNPYTQWFFTHRDTPKSEQLISDWGTLIREAFGPLLSHFSKS